MSASVQQKHFASETRDVSRLTLNFLVPVELGSLRTLANKQEQVMAVIFHKTFA